MNSTDRIPHRKADATMEKKVRVGIIGAGFAANMFAQSFTLVERACLAGVTSLNHDASAQFAQKYDIPRVFSNSAEMVASPQVDAVYIATHPSDHKARMMEALRAGKHVICEKPFCLSAEDAQEVFAYATQHGLLAMEAMRGNFLPATLDLEARIKEGVIGQVRTVITQMGMKMDPRDGKNRVFQPSVGGGCLYELGCYCVNSIMGILGTAPERLHISNTICPTYGVDLGSTIIMEYTGGTVGVAVSSITHMIPSVLTICGTNGSITVPKFHFATSFDVVRNKRYFPDFSDVQAEHVELPYESSNEQFEAQAFVDAILAGKTFDEHMLPERTVGILKTIGACLQCA